MEKFIYFLIKAAFICAIVGIALSAILKANGMNSNYGGYTTIALFLVIIFYRYRKNNLTN